MRSKMKDRREGAPRFGVRRRALRDKRLETRSATRERRCSAAAEHERDSLFAALAQHAPIGIFLNDAAGNCVYVNARFCELLQIAPPQALGQGWIAFVHPEDREGVLRWHERATVAQHTDRREFRCVRPDGLVTWVIAKSAPLRSDSVPAGRIGTLVDITERMLAEGALLQSNRKMQAVLDASPLAILSMDDKGRILAWNGGAERMFGWTEREAFGRVCPTVPETELADFHDMIRRVLAGEPFRGKVRYRRRKTGELVLAAISAAPLRDAAGEAVSIVAVLDDVTEREQAAQRLAMLTAEREHFVQDLHDGCIQSIYAIGLHLEATRHLIAAEPHAARERVADAAANLNLVIEELRLVLKGAREISGGPDMRAALGTTIAMLGERAPRFAVDIDEAVAASLTARQATQLTQIAREAISNAARHADAGTGRVSLGRLANGAVRLEVSDDGCGLDHGARDKEGLGLRHMSARAFKLGGRCTVVSAPGKGTRITVEIPHAQ